MKDLDLPSLLLLARQAGDEAAALVMKGYRSRPHVDHKGRIDLVTEFDRASEALIRGHLTSKTPFAFVGEEGGAVRGEREDLVWYVDPLDGTSNFVHGHPFWNVSIGLVLRGEPILGVVVAPAIDLRWTGAKGIPSERNGVPCRVSSVAHINDALLATGFSYDFEAGGPDNVQEFIAMKRRCLDVRRCGSAAIDLSFVADGTYEGYWEQKLKPWDFAGGGAIVLAAGGKISAFNGGAPDILSGALLASNGLVHDEMVAVLG